MTSAAELFNTLKYRIVVNPATGTRRYYNHANQLHREDGPAIEYSDGAKCWYRNGKLHREDGPAVEYADGVTAWYQNNLLHRTDGPAVEWKNVGEEWWQNGQLHRVDGPAVIQYNGRKFWYLHDKEFTNIAQYTACVRQLSEIC